MKCPIWRNSLRISKTSKYQLEKAIATDSQWCHFINTRGILWSLLCSLLCFMGTDWSDLKEASIIVYSLETSLNRVLRQVSVWGWAGVDD